MTGKTIMILVMLIFFAIPVFSVKAGAAGLDTQQDKANYGLGVSVIRNMQQLGVEIDLDTMLKGMKDALAGGKLLLSEDELKKIVIDYQQEMMRRQKYGIRITAEENHTKGQAFLAENAKKEGVVTLPSGLQYKILKNGDGKKPGDNDLVMCNYRGTHLDGSEFDGTYADGKPRMYQVSGGVIPAWREALKLMPVGSKWMLYVPPQLAYGEKGAGKIIGPGETLIYEVELLAIK